MKQLPRYLRIAAACLAVFGVADCIRMAVCYDTMLTAVPLWMLLALDGGLYLLPAALLLVVAALLARRHKEK